MNLHFINYERRTVQFPLVKQRIRLQENVVLYSGTLVSRVSKKRISSIVRVEWLLRTIRYGVTTHKNTVSIYTTGKPQTSHSSNR
jgi:hypothetical protein